MQAGSPERAEDWCRIIEHEAGCTIIKQYVHRERVEPL